MISKELVQLREVNIVLLAALEKLSLHKDKSVSLAATEALNKAKDVHDSWWCCG